MDKLIAIYPSPYSLEDFIRAFNPDNGQFILLLIVSGLTFLFGFLEYIYSFLLVRKDKSAPFPPWMHTFYLAHDSMGIFVFFSASKEVGGFWFFDAAALSLVVWNLFEVYNLYKCVTTERQDLWGHLYEEPVTLANALIKIVGQILIFIGIVHVLRIFMHDSAMYQWFLFTNVVMAIVPGLYWEKRKSRKGTSLPLAIVILLGTVITFQPWSMWALVSNYFSMGENPWLIFLGAVCIGSAVRNIIVLKKLPK